MTDHNISYVAIIAKSYFLKLVEQATKAESRAIAAREEVNRAKNDGESEGLINVLCDQADKIKHEAEMLHDRVMRLRQATLVLFEESGQSE